MSALSGGGTVKAMVAGWVGGFVGNGFLGALFSAPLVRDVLYDPSLQSEVFRALTPTRDIPLSVTGLVLLSALHGVVFRRVAGALPGAGWFGKGVWWGVGIWAMYWLFQEWFIYVTLLREPVLLAALELTILLGGSLVEGIVISWLVHKWALRA